VRLTSRNARLGVLVAWSCVFAWLWFSGDVLRYLGPRTSWVVTFGAVALGGATLAYAYFSAHSRAPERALSRREAGGLAALVVPILLVILLSSASLGALAASRKLTSRGIDLDSLAASLSSNARDTSFLELKAASENADTESQLNIHPGQQVNLLGFVSKAAPSPAGPFQLSRFYITCCVADSIPVGVTVYPTLTRGSYSTDAWLTVKGALAKQGSNYVVKAESIRHVSEPKNPYLSIAGSGL
jgi:putative membrane protein